MGRNYEANVSIANPRRDRETAIREALRSFGRKSDCFELGGIYCTERGLDLVAQISLFCIGDDDYASSLAACIWKANQGFCEIEVTMIYLDDQPREEYVFDQDEFEGWRKTSGGDG